MKRCKLCTEFCLRGEWILAYPVSVETATFCSHLCLFNWLRQEFGTAMTNLTFFRKGAATYCACDWRKPEDTSEMTPEGACRRCGGLVR